MTNNIPSSPRIVLFPLFSNDVILSLRKLNMNFKSNFFSKAIDTRCNTDAGDFL